MGYLSTLSRPAATHKSSVLVSDVVPWSDVVTPGRVRLCRALPTWPP